MGKSSSRLRAAAGGRPSLARLEWLLFLTLWLAYGLAINSGNLEAFTLQQAGVEAYVERGNFYLEGSQVPRLQIQPVVDAFLYEGHIYPAKQPGQFMAGACVYFVLRAFGLSYAGNYLLTAALVTFFTASLVTAASAIALFRAARVIAPDSALRWPLLAALAYGLASTACAYSGIAYHDTLATGYLAIAFYLAIRLARADDEGAKGSVLAACCGALLGLTVTTSMLPFFMVVVVALYVVSLRRWKLLPFFLLGGLAGLLPLLIYNAICFGSPLLLPNFAGHYSDTYFHPEWGNFLDKLAFYARMLTLYVPVFWLGLGGLALYTRACRREQAFIIAALIALAAYVLNIEANGTCQYGPRYLLPAMPFACLGLAGFNATRGRALKRVLLAIVLALFLLSLFINLVGAMHGAMLCDFPRSALRPYLTEMLRGGRRAYPLAAWLLLPFIACASLFVRTLIARRSAAASVKTKMVIKK